MAKNYVNVETDAERDEVLSRRATLPPMVRGASFEKYLKDMNVSFFMQPFHHLNALALDTPLPQSFMVASEEWIKKNFNTLYGGGRVLNKLLFPNEPREMLQEGKYAANNALPYLSGQNHILFGIILFNSEWGNRITRINTAAFEAQPARLRENSYCQVQVFLYRLCELRKAQQIHRYKYHRLWADPKARAKERERHKVAKRWL